METYESETVASKHGYWNLGRATNDGGFILWAGYDGSRVGPGMCGHWQSQSEWHASQNWDGC